MSVETPSVDTDEAQRIIDLGDEAADGRSDAIDYLDSHDLVSALRYVAKRNSLRSISFTREYDSDTTEPCEVLGFKVSRDDTERPQIQFKSRYGTKTRSLREASDKVLSNAVDAIDTTAVATAAINEVESELDKAMEAGSKV